MHAVCVGAYCETSTVTHEPRKPHFAGDKHPSRLGGMAGNYALYQLLSPKIECSHKHHCLEAMPVKICLT